MTCDEAKPVLADYWNHSLDEAQELALEGHLASCQACHAEAERLGALWKNLASIPGEDPGEHLRGRFYEALSAYRQGLESAARPRFKDRLLSWWPKQPAWQMAAAGVLLAVGMGIGYGMRPERPKEDVAQLREEVTSMRQLVALSLLQQQSASERLRGVSWAYRAEPSDREVFAALVSAINHDANMNVRLAAVDALHTFGALPETRQAVLQALPQSTPMVQIALIDLLVDFKDHEASGELHKLAVDGEVNGTVRQHAEMALEKLQ